MSRLVRLSRLLLFCIALVPAALLAQAQPKPAPGQAVATFAGGCFWCMEQPFDVLPGVISTTSGYIDGTKVNPTYEEVTRGTTGHTEAVQVVYDPSKVSYEKLLEVFWRNIDPTTPNAQFCDHGSQYRSGIYTHDQEQHRLATESRARIDRNKSFREPIVTEIKPAKTFYRAEEYHQDYYKKNPLRYKYYRSQCGRDARLEQLWGKAPAKYTRRIRQPSIDRNPPCCRRPHAPPHRPSALENGVALTTEVGQRAGQGEQSSRIRCAHDGKSSRARPLRVGKGGANICDRLRHGRKPETTQQVRNLGRQCDDESGRALIEPVDLHRTRP